MKRNLSLFSLSIALTFYSYSKGQNTSNNTIKVSKADSSYSSYKFIEPNISVSYDSNFFKITRRYLNTFYEAESYDFLYQKEASKKVTINIKADYPIKSPPQKERDSLIFVEIKEIADAVNDTFSITNIEKRIKNIKGFSCVGFVGCDKLNKKCSTLIKCYHLSDEDNTEVSYFSQGNDLEVEYQLLNSFLSGINFYSKQEIDNEDSLIKSKYIVIVTPSAIVIDDFKHRPATFLGFVSVNQKLEHKISEVRLNGSLGQEIFLITEGGQVPILTNDNQKGNINKRGELVLINSFGKKVKLPFTFTYLNKGRL